MTQRQKRALSENEETESQSVNSAGEKAVEEVLSMPKLLGKNILVYLFWFIIFFVGGVVVFISYIFATGGFDYTGPGSGVGAGLLIILEIFWMLVLGGIGFVGVIIETMLNKRPYRTRSIKKVLLVATILISVIITLAIFAVYTEREKRMYDRTQQLTPTTQQPTSSPQPAAIENFFEVKELGFKIPLGDNFKAGELTYTISTDNTQSVKLSTKRLKALSEKCQDGSIGTITKIMGAVPSNSYYVQKNIQIPINVSFGDFYLSYEKQTAPCALGEATSWQTYVMSSFSQIFERAVLSE